MGLIDLTQAQAEQAAELDAATGSSPWPEQRWRGALGAQPWHARGVLAGGQLAGLAMAGLAQRPGGALVMVTALLVAPQWREIGIGTLLMDDLCAHADTQQLPLVFALQGDAQQLEGFLSRHGFRVHDRADETLVLARQQP
jgi:GNAT superfamily N-acetyltransferase